MPNKDKTGPDGQGPMTGRGLGTCGKEQGAQMGLGRCWGRGFGRARCPARFSAGFTKEERKKILEAELKAIQSEN